MHPSRFPSTPARSNRRQFAWKQRADHSQVVRADATACVGAARDLGEPQVRRWSARGDALSAGITSAGNCAVLRQRAHLVGASSDVDKHARGWREANSVSDARESAALSQAAEERVAGRDRGEHQIVLRRMRVEVETVKAISAAVCSKRAGQIVQRADVQVIARKRLNRSHVAPTFDGAIVADATTVSGARRDVRESSAIIRRLALIQARMALETLPLVRRADGTARVQPRADLLSAAAHQGQAQPQHCDERDCSIPRHLFKGKKRRERANSSSSAQTVLPAMKT